MWLVCTATHEPSRKKYKNTSTSIAHARERGCECGTRHTSPLGNKNMSRSIALHAGEGADVEKQHTSPFRTTISRSLDCFIRGREYECRTTAHERTVFGGFLKHHCRTSSPPRRNRADKTGTAQREVRRLTSQTLSYRLRQRAEYVIPAERTSSLAVRLVKRCSYFRVETFNLFKNTLFMLPVQYREN